MGGGDCFQNSQIGLIEHEQVDVSNLQPRGRQGLANRFRDLFTACLNTARPSIFG